MKDFFVFLLLIETSAPVDCIGGDDVGIIDEIRIFQRWEAV